MFQWQTKTERLISSSDMHSDSMNVAKKIFLVEDDPDIVQLLQLHFTEPHFALTSCGNGMKAVEELEINHYDLIILDIMLPGTDGLEVCKMIRQNKVMTPVIMLTSRAEEIDKVLALELGADDYVTKPFSIRELMARAKAIFRRLEQPYALQPDNDEANEISIKDLFINKDKRQVIINNNHLELTVKEFDLLYLLAGNPGKTFSRQQMLEEVWGYSFKGYEHTVTSHINRLRMKIEPDLNDPVYILTTWGVGYRFTE